MYKYHTNDGAVVVFKNAAFAKKAMCDSGFIEWFEVGMSADVSWGADAEEAQKDAEFFIDDEELLRSIIGVESGEGE
jgi:hypothetical protein